MKHYRDKFPQVSILPKMHIMEEHVILWVENDGVQEAETVVLTSRSR